LDFASGLACVTHVFWRKPDGRPYKGRDGKFAPTALLAEIGSTATLDPQGGVSWKGLNIPLRLEPAILESTSVVDSDDNEINSADASSIIWPAILETIKKSGGGRPLKPAEVIARANRDATSYFRRPSRKFVILTSLSVSSFPQKQISLRDCSITPMKMRGKRYPYPEALKFQAAGTPVEGHLASSKYLFVKVVTTARTEWQALENALESIHFLRGIWMLIATYGSWSLFSGLPTRRPVGIIHVGPIHTVHHQDGRLATDTYWYEPGFTGDQRLFSPVKGWAKIEDQRRKAARSIKRLPYRHDIEQLVIRYALALDESNLNVAFLHLWGILEKVTDTVGGNYDETIRRATRLDPEREAASETLRALRCRRNRVVHGGDSSEEREHIVYMIKSFVDPHLVHLIQNEPRVNSLQEYGEYLAVSRTPPAPREYPPPATLRCPVL